MPEVIVEPTESLVIVDNRDISPGVFVNDESALQQRQSVTKTESEDSQDNYLDQRMYLQKKLLGSDDEKVRFSNAGSSSREVPAYEQEPTTIWTPIGKVALSTIKDARFRPNDRLSVNNASINEPRTTTEIVRLI